MHACIYIYIKRRTTAMVSHDFWHCVIYMYLPNFSVSQHMRMCIYVHIFTCISIQSILHSKNVSHDFWHCCARLRAQQCHNMCDALVVVRVCACACVRACVRGARAGEHVFNPRSKPSWYRTSWVWDALNWLRASMTKCQVETLKGQVETLKCQVELLKETLKGQVETLKGQVETLKGQVERTFQISPIPIRNSALVGIGRPGSGTPYTNQS